ncbi:MAG: cell division protein FtsX [Minisyncoccales bacterium]
MFVLIKRIFYLGWRDLFRDGGMVTVNIFIMVTVIAVITSLFILKDISQILIAAIQEKVDVSVYFNNDINETDILRVKEEIAHLPEVKEVTYISKEEALRRFTEKYQSNPILLEALSEVGINPFLPALGIKAFQAQQYEAIANFLKNSSFNNLIEKVDYYQRKSVIDRIYTLLTSFKQVGLVLFIVLTLIAILVAFNTIRLAIYNSREEIKIQRLVGASNWFIKGPFLVQGAICGSLAALICLLIFSLLAATLNEKIETLFPGFSFFQFFINRFWLIVSLQLLTGIGLSVASSHLAVKKYLKI